MASLPYDHGGAHIYLVAFPHLGLWKLGKTKESLGGRNLTKQLSAARTAVLRNETLILGRHDYPADLQFPGPSERWVVDLFVDGGGRLGFIDWGTAERIEHTAAAWFQGKLEGVEAWIGGKEYLLTAEHPPRLDVDWPNMLAEAVTFTLDLAGFSHDRSSEPYRL